MKKYTAIYFNKTNKIIKEKKPASKVLLQFFQRKNDSILCGMNEVLTFLKENTNTNEYKINYLAEGSKINKGDVVLELEGNYRHFGIYEGIIDGILSRSTSLATNAYQLKKETSKPIIFMGDRSDHYSNQSRDGYAISIGGIGTQVTEAQVERHNGKAIGTMPHALIQMFDGDVIMAARSYQEVFPNENLTVLIDFNNDVIGDGLKCLKTFGKKLFAVRVDTSPNMSDKFFKKDEEFGVSPNLIKELRSVFDDNDGEHVKIIISSGIDKDKIKVFEKENTPVDFYGVGSALLKINNTFTADAVKIDGKKIAKKGRGFKKVNLQSFKG